MESGNNWMIIPESDIDRVMRKEAKVADVARKWGTSRQAVYSRLKYERKHHEIMMRRWLALFLFRVGMPCREISDELGYRGETVRVVLRSYWNVSCVEVFGVVRPYRNARKRYALLRQWKAQYLMRLGFDDEDVANMTGYAPGTIKQYRRRFGFGR